MFLNHQLRLLIISIYFFQTSGWSWKKIFITKRSFALFETLNPLTNGEDKMASFIDDIINIVDHLVALDNAPGGITKVNPQLLVENSHVLAKGRYYEAVMQEKTISAKDRSKIESLERVDSFLKGFISAERKSRARLKMNYILAGAASGRFEESMLMLSQSDEIDNELLNYVSSLIKKELLQAAGPSLLLDDNEKKNAEKVEKNLEGAAKETIKILRMVEKRLKAQLTMDGRDEVKLLALLMQQSYSEERMSILRTHLRRVEAVEGFSVFLDEAVRHLTNPEPRSKPTELESETSGLDNEKSGFDAETSGFKVEDIRVIQMEVGKMLQQLQTGLRENAAYSTLPEDYIENDNSP